MQAADIRVFQQLKVALANRYRLSFPEGKPDISAWKGQEIVNFQEDLAEKVNGRISEKWFYTHLKKADNDRLPRIDVLNMLSQYAGFRDWSHFVQEHPSGTEEVEVKETILTEEGEVGQKGEKSWRMAYGWLLLVPILLMGVGVWWNGNEKARFCVVDAYTLKMPIESEPEVWWLKAGESPIRMKIDKNGCFAVRTKKEEIQLLIKAPYYQEDTILRSLPLTEDSETLMLYPDDYARMLHYYSTDNMQDWKKRRTQLQEIFAEEARIFQVEAGSELGMEMYNKQEFINKLCLPISTLRNIRVLEIQYKNSRILRLRFSLEAEHEK